jgi:hypothetical protein
MQLMPGDMTFPALFHPSFDVSFLGVLTFYVSESGFTGL